MKPSSLLQFLSLPIAAIAFGGLTGSASAFSPSVSGVKAALRHGKTGAALELHAAKALLERADHDYEGHRAKAVHHITEALHELNGHHHQQHHKTSQPQHTQHHSSGKNMKKEPQNVSDAQLREAAALVAKAQAQLGTSHSKVQSQLALAEKEIAAALKIR